MSQMTLVVGTEVIKRILSDFNPIYTNDDLLALCTITGGVPKYMSWILDNGCTTQAQMYKYFFSENSHFLEEGRTLLVSESGKNYGTYFSILQENIKSWWRNKAISYKGNTIDAEVDIIALPMEGTTALVAEVKREKEQYRHDLFMLKVAYLQQTELKEYKVKTKLYTLEDM